MQNTRLLYWVAACWLAIFAPVRSATTAPFEFREGLIWVQVQLRDFGPATFLLDSGAGATLIDGRVAKMMDLPEGKARRVQGVGGVVAAVVVHELSGNIGGVSIPSSALALDLRSIAGSGPRIDGLLGIDFLQGRTVQIDFAARVLRFLSPEEATQVQGEAIPLSRKNDCFAIRIAIDGEGPQWVRFDTGCDSAVEWVSSEGSNNSSRPTLSRVQLGKLNVPHVKVGRRASAIFPGEGGLIGNGLLSRYCVTLDLARRRVVLANH